MAGRLAERLVSAGHEVCSEPTRLEPPETWLDALAADAELLVAVGGDGTVRLVAPSAARIGVPVTHFPAGTENLFAREWGMSPSAESLLEAIRHASVIEADLACARTSPPSVTHTCRDMFLLMLSVGFDANVVHDLAAHRRSRISHLTYVPSILRQMFSYRPPRLWIEVDGRPVGRPGDRGFVVVANGARYALGLNPVPEASMTSRRLNVALFPAESVPEVFDWIPHLVLRTQLDDPRVARAAGERVTIVSDEPVRFQVDGDPPRVRDAVPRIEIELLPERLRVLLPGGVEGSVPGGAPGAFIATADRTVGTTGALPPAGTDV